MEDEKIKFDFNDFEKIWKEELEEADAEIKEKITAEEKEFARGFYFALDYLETAIANATDIIDDETDTITKIKSEIIEQAGEEIKGYMLGDFYDVITSTLESHVE